MDVNERKVLTILFNTNKTVFQAQKSNKHRLASFDNINESRYERLEGISITPFNEPIKMLRDEIQNMLYFSNEYLNFLRHIPQINLYDAAELIVEIGDIKRFKNRKHFLSYAGLAPVVRNNNKYNKVKRYTNGKIVANKKQDPIDYCEDLKKVIMRCTSKLIKSDYTYAQYYEQYKDQYKYKHPKYNKKHLHLMALKKTAIIFAKEIYKEFNNAIKEE